MPEVSITRAGLALDGQPVYLLAGQTHYFRWPRAEWRAILLSAVAGGLNAVDTVVPWNLHEPAPGQYDFDDMADLPAYLDLCAELGLYAIVRPGPYICAEWENGGLPAWLGPWLGAGAEARSGMRYRLDDPAYLDATLRWFDVLMPHIVARQADRGGPVILVQLENEHWASGVYGHDGHQATLAQALRERGVTVPLYTCMGALPGIPEFRNGWNGIDRKLEETRSCWPDNPMIVSELWSGWFDNWASSAHNGKSPAALDAQLHELAAIGAGGFSHWMWAGGTNFGFWGGRTVGGDLIFNTTSYDYDAPVSEYGVPRAKFYVARRHHLFLGTLGARLAARLADAAPGAIRAITARAVPGRSGGGGAVWRNVRSDDLQAIYLRNDSSDRQTYQVFIPPVASGHGGAADPVHLQVEVEPGTLKPIFAGLPLGESGLTLGYHTGRLLGFWQRGQAYTLIVYGTEGEAGQLALCGLAESDWAVGAGGPGMGGPTSCAVRGDTLEVRYWIKDRPQVVRATASGAGAALDLQVIVLTQARAERCWPWRDGGWLVGPDFVAAGRSSTSGAWPFYTIDAGGTVASWAGEMPGVLAHRRAGTPARAPALANWEVAEADELASETGWQAAEHDGQPLSFERLGCALGYGWYRARVDVEEAGAEVLAAPGLADRAHLFVDGELRGTLGVGPDGPALALPLALAAGPHDVRMLVDNLGRFNYGSGLGEPKGLLANLYWGARRTELTRGWNALWQEAAFAGEAIANASPAHVRPDAGDVDLSNFAFQGPELWLLREFAIPPGRQALLYLVGDRNPGALFVNGRPVARFSRHHGGGFFKHDVTGLLRPAGPNVIALNIRDYAGLPWRVWLLTYDPARPLAAGWRFRAGITPRALWRPLAGSAPAGPAFYRAHFAYDPARHGNGPFSLDVAELDKGQLWLNGHNLGRYWQVGPQEFYKLPASWLARDNELLIFAETDSSPQDVGIRTVRSLHTIDAADAS